MTDPENSTLLAQAIEQAKREAHGEATLSVEHAHATDTTTFTGSVKAEGQRWGASWFAKLWGKWTVKPGRDDGTLGGDVGAKW